MDAKIYKLKVGEYKGYADIEMKIPEGVKFFYSPGVIGRGLSKDCEHYTTVVEIEKYKEWYDYIFNSPIFGVIDDVIGDYAVITILDLHKDTPVPTVDREEWLKANGIDFGKYTLVTYDSNFIPMNAYRIKSFQDIWNIDVTTVTVRDFFSLGEFFSISNNTVELSSIKPSIFAENRYALKTYEGNKANVIWNTMLSKVISLSNYNPEYADDSYDFLEVQKKFLKDIGVSSIEEFNNLIEGR